MSIRDPQARALVMQRSSGSSSGSANTGPGHAVTPSLPERSATAELDGTCARRKPRRGSAAWRGAGTRPAAPARCRARPARLHPLPAAAGRRRRGPRPQQLPPPSPPSPGTPLLTLKRAKTGRGGGLISDATSVTTFWTRRTKELLTLIPPVKPLQLILLPTRARSTPAGRRFSFCLDSPSRRAAAPAVPDQRHCFCSHNCCRLLAFVTKCSLLGTPQAQNQCDLLNLKARSSVKEQTSCHQTERVHFGTTAFTSTKTKPPPRYLQCPRCSAASKQDPRSFQKRNRATNVSKRAREMAMNLFPGELTLIT